MGLVISASGLWALDTLIRYPLVHAGVPAVAIVFYEHFLLSLLSLVLFVRILNSFKFSLDKFWSFFVIGALGSGLATICFTRAFEFLNPSLVIILQKLQPVVAIILARFVLKEPIRKEFLFWAVLCLVGGGLVSYEHLKEILAAEHFSWAFFMQDRPLLGLGLTLVSIVSWGASTVYGKKLATQGLSEEQIMGGRYMMGLLAITPLLFWRHVPLSFSVDIYGKISLMVIVSGVLAMYLFYQGLKRLSARACSLAEMFFPFMAVIVNWLFLGASLDQIQLLGGGLLLFSSLVIQIRKY